MHTPANRGFSFRGQKHADPNHSNIIIDTQVFSRLSKSRWFTRGWTLQELLAPSQMIFFAADWTVLGDRNEISSWITDITGIHIGALKDKSMIPRYTIAQRMSWAATRETTRLEDIAYCLLGIFNIHMPMLYGEGDAAFGRLQQEIMKTSDDHSIFAWSLQGTERELCTGALAPSPQAFLSCGSLVRDDATGRLPFAITNLGISIELSLMRSWCERIFLVGLNCARELRGRDDLLNILPSRTTVYRRYRVWIFLQRVQGEIYQRIHLPASIALLQPLYLSSTPVTKSTLFIEIQKSPQYRLLPLPAPLVPDIHNSIQCPLFSSGLMVTLGWGTLGMFNRYEQAYNPGQFFSQTLKRSSLMGISHQLVSGGDFSLLLSVAWNQKMEPQSWTHSAFADPQREFLSRIVGGEKWEFLVNDGIQTPTRDLKILVSTLSHIHKQLRCDFEDAFLHASRSATAPTVIFSTQELQNLHGQCELLVEVIFREKPKLLFL